MMITNRHWFLGLVFLQHASVVISSTQIGGGVSSSNAETVPRRRKITYRHRSAGADGDDHHHYNRDLGIGSHIAAVFDAIQTMGEGKGKGGGGGGGTKSPKSSKAPTISKAPSISKTPKGSKAPTASKAPSGCDGKGKGSSRSGTKVSKRRDYVLLVYIFVCVMLYPSDRFPTIPILILPNRHQRVHHRLREAAGRRRPRKDAPRPLQQMMILEKTTDFQKAAPMRIVSRQKTRANVDTMIPRTKFLAQMTLHVAAPLVTAAAAAFSAEVVASMVPAGTKTARTMPLLLRAVGNPTEPSVRPCS